MYGGASAEGAEWVESGRGGPSPAD